jgi:hypothetical protein
LDRRRLAAEREAAAQPLPSPPNGRDSAAERCGFGSAERSGSSRGELGEGSAQRGRSVPELALGGADLASPPFSPPNSPRRRQTTFGATLDFIEALCTASSGLTAFPRELLLCMLRLLLCACCVLAGRRRRSRRRSPPL